MMDLSLTARRDRAVASKVELVEKFARLRTRLADNVATLRPGNRQSEARLRRTRGKIKRLAERLDAIEREIAHFDISPVEADKAPAQLLRLLNNALEAQGLRRALRDAAGGRLKLSLTQSRAILTMRAGRPRQKFRRRDLRLLETIRAGLLDELLAALGLSAGAGTGSSRPQLATLLPVRLETRFDQPDAARPDWQLRLRIIPDRPWFSSHQDLPSHGELDDIEQFWRNLEGESPASALGREAFARIARHHGAPRALWLMRSFPVTGTDTGGQPTITRPANRKPEIAVNRIVDFPSSLEVWAEHGGNLSKLAVLQVDANGLALDLGDPVDPTQTRWWQCFKTAQAVGLAAEIPLPMHPRDIDALFVTGIGPHAPDRIFSEHRDAGVLSVLPAGTATNTVDGAPAGADESDPRWLELLGVPASAQASTRALGAFLTGTADTVGPIPGGDLVPEAAARDVLSAIWPAAWGHAMADIFGGGEAVDRLGLWAGQTVAPRGDIPTLRIGRAIYGVLPVTAMAKWEPAPGDPTIEREIVPGLGRAMAALADRAEIAGTAVDADTERLMEIVAQPAISTGLAARQMIDGRLLQMLAYRVGEGISQAELIRLYENGAGGLRDAGLYHEPVRHLFAVGPPLDITAPLVTPLNSPDFPTFGDLVKRLLQFDDGLMASDKGLREIFGNARPRSLLFEFVLRALRLTAARARLAAKAPDLKLLEELSRDELSAGRVEQLILQLMPADLALNNPQTIAYRAVRDAVLRLTEHDDATLEQALLATLDCASHRIDPFITAVSARRLRASSAMSPVRLLGAYGWVDRPFNGAAGPVPETLLLAPSQAQAATAALLRDRSLSDADPARWAMDVTSGAVRRAALLADEVRAGVHLAEALGRMIEDAVKTPASITALRDAFPQRADETGRATCDGLAVLRASPGLLPLSAAEQAGLDPWRKALDTYGDLLLSEAVHHAANGRPARAQAAMEAAAGLTAPPNFDLLATPRDTSEAVTTVLFAVPPATPPAAVGTFTHPVAIAEPSLLAFAIAHYGAADTAAWTWQVTPDGGGATTDVTLNNMGLDVADVLTTGAEALTNRAIATAGVAGKVTDGDGLRNHAILRRLAATVARDPAARSDLYGMPDASPDQRAELLQRFGMLRDAAQALVAELQNQAGTGGTPAGRDAALAAAESWGIRPLPQAIANLNTGTRCGDASQVLDRRLGAAPSVADAAGLDLSRLAELIAALATQDGRLPVLSMVPMPDAPEPVPVNPSPAGTDGLSGFEEEWLSVVAAVREPLARIETLQLDAIIEGVPPLSIWTDRPTDPWQMAAHQDPDGRRRGTQLRVVFGPAGTLEGLSPQTPVAMGLVDAWSERVPETDQSAGLAFHFNAPSARAQNAILAVTPPRLRDPLDVPVLIDALRDARALARARMVPADRVSDFASALSLALLPAGGGMTDRLTGDQGTP
ncbi:MAG: hypothetical protein GY815_04620 [Gammaproteobacteria bacterium]|nr:hypothetical protein [Gammaproteobacteria bacterium]